MARAWWPNALLAVAVAALALFVYLRPHSDEAASHAVSTLKAQEVRTIRVERAGSAPIVLEKRADDWLVTAPFAARADPVRVKRLLELVGARAASRLPSSDLARYDLDRPTARLALDGQRFDFGMVNPISREQYVLTGDAVYPLSAQYGAALPASAADLASKRLLAEGEVPAGIALADFSVVRRDGKWVLDPPAGELSQDDLQKWVDDWRHASAVRVTVQGEGKPLGEIGLQLQQGGALRLAILAREPELALLRADEKLVYHFLGGQARRLLSRPGEALTKPTEEIVDAKPQSRKADR